MVKIDKRPETTQVKEMKVLKKITAGKSKSYTSESCSRNSLDPKEKESVSRA